jgi:hypothetical protein
MDCVFDAPQQNRFIARPAVDELLKLVAKC